LDVGSDLTNGLKSICRTLGKLDLRKCLSGGVGPGNQSLATSSVDGASKRGCDGDGGSGLSADSSNSKGSNGGNDGLHIKERSERKETEIIK
jgi:hypothetical protein